MARGAAIIKPGQHRNKVKWKDAAPAQRVPDRRNKKLKRDTAQIQRVPGQIKLREHNDPREGVLDTLQVSMHPNVGPDTGGTRITAPCIAQSYDERPTVTLFVHTTMTM